MAEANLKRNNFLHAYPLIIGQNRAMRSPQHIVIFHPAAIGDSMMASPVAMVLKNYFPDAKITYWSHSSLRPLILDMCPYIDQFLDFKKENVFRLLTQLKGTKCDLFIDLSSSLRGSVLSAFGAGRALRMTKKKKDDIAFGHMVDNFLDAIRPLCPQLPERLFPTLDLEKFPQSSLSPDVVLLKGRKENLIGIVPGVGKLRPNRAWPEKNWIELIEFILSSGHFVPVLVGGPEEVDLGLNLSNKFPSCINLCGKLSLAQTAYVLKLCKIVVSADTGPAHIATAVGTPVLGMYGPTQASRYGPYDCRKDAIDMSDSCKCLYEKACHQNSGEGSGECMKAISTQVVLDRLQKQTGA